MKFRLVEELEKQYTEREIENIVDEIFKENRIFTNGYVSVPWGTPPWDTPDDIELEIYDYLIEEIDIDNYVDSYGDPYQEIYIDIKFTVSESTEWKSFEIELFPSELRGKDTVKSYIRREILNAADDVGFLINNVD